MTLTMFPERQRSEVGADGAVRVTVPIMLKRKGGIKFILTPEGSPSSPFKPVKMHDALVKALVKAFQWKEQIESGQAQSMRDLARQEGKSHSYILKIIRLTLLSPDIVEAILNGKQPKTLELEDLLTFLPAHWPEQRSKFGFEEPSYTQQ